MEILTYQGQDDQILIRAWQDNEKTIPASIDVLDDIEVRIISDNNTILGRWNKTGGGVFEALTRIDAYNYWFYFETNDDTRIGKASLWVETKINNAALADGVLNGVSTKKDLLNIQEKDY